VQLGRDRTVAEIVTRLRTGRGGDGPVRVEGTWGSFARLLTAHISRVLSRPVLHICPHIDDADFAAEDLRTFGAKSVMVLPAWEGEEELADATDETRAERLRVSLNVASGADKPVISAPIQAICQPIPNPQALQETMLELAKNKTMPPEQLTGWLVDNGFERVERVDLPGQFARRGGIVDIFAPLLAEIAAAKQGAGGCGQRVAAAIRIDFFADTIESIRQIDLDSQLSGRELKAVSIVSVIAGSTEQQRQLFVKALPADCIMVIEEPTACQEVAGILLARASRPERLCGWSEIYKAMSEYSRLHIHRFAASGDGVLKLDVKSVQQYQHNTSTSWMGHKAALQQLVEEAVNGKTVLLYCESTAEKTRLEEILREIRPKLPARLRLLQGYVHRGFAVGSLKSVFITHHELFGRYSLLRRMPRPSRPTAPIDTLSDLQPGDYVVHVSYGIGRFCGIKTIEEKHGKSEYLTIEYADSVKIQVAATNIALVQKYIGTSPKRPRLSKVGSKRWQRQKEKVSRSVHDLAAELLNVQARRLNLGGISYGPDTNWQREFEESFPYQETPDQITAVEEIKADMQQPVAMDRLLCGDVGYGKTELAMRAAFKTIENGKQVAVLAPTTVLCVQHGRTFAERFAGFPVNIEVLNRFRTPTQARDIIARTKAGRVDILIGTHRLLSGDVGFRDLGLLIIDEEQRFGVADKERLKKMRVNVDILTMTATPIPRTLHMALLGLRDISALATPPLDRRSIVTTVTAYDDELIKRAIYRELNRRGQVFFLHNRVRSIAEKAWEIQKLVPDARVAVAHGQMPKTELENTMIGFVLGQVDILVCTTIIESGLDIPNANTIFINDADRFGLAEMHQLRGRVGRYKHRAYAYMLLPTNRSITPVAARRLKAIEEYSHLGAGFRIALRDLEIRGAGNILGPEQSGHIQMVGYQMYCDLLADAVRKLRNEPCEPLPTATIDLGFSTYIPRNYIPIDRHRMDVYRKIAVARNDQDLKQVESELADIYGPIPDDVRLLLELADLRILAGRHDIKSIAASGRDLVFSFSKDPERKAASLFAGVSGKSWVGDSNTAYMRLKESCFEPNTLIAILRKILGGESCTQQKQLCH